jgi:hypothetical protein
LFVVLFIPFFINIFTKIYVFRPLVEYFWDTKQTEIFLNYELQEKAFTEIRNFEEKIYFDYLLKTSEGPQFQGGFTWPQNENKPNLSSFVVFEGPNISKPFFFSEAPFFLWEKFEATKSLRPSSLKKNQKEGTMSLLSSVFSLKCNLSEPHSSLFFSEATWVKHSLTQTKKAGCDKKNFLSQNQNWNDFGFSKTALNFDSTEPRKFEATKSLRTFSMFFLSNSINSRLETVPVNFQVGPNLSNLERNGEEGLPSRAFDSIRSGGAFYFSKNTESIFRQKTRELADHYNKESISALTNLLADFMGLIILLILLRNMKMSLMNTTAFLSESFFSLKDSKKAFLMLLFTDLLVGFHSPRGWEVIFHFLFEHFGLPENHNIIFLLVGTFPVLLDALFKYWIFRHLNRHSPATVATFQAMVE